MDFIYDWKCEFKLLAEHKCRLMLCSLKLFSYADSGVIAGQNSTNTIYVFFHQIYKNDRKSTFLGAFDSEKPNV